MILGLGFVTIAQSSFEMKAGMGALTALVIIVALIVDLVLMPALLAEKKFFRVPNALRHNS